MKFKLKLLMVPLLGLSNLSCQQQFTGVSTPSWYGPNTTTGIVTGAGVGALAGGIIGAGKDKIGRGIAIGALAGGAVGGAVGYGLQRNGVGGDMNPPDYSGGKNPSVQQPNYGYTDPGQNNYNAAGAGYNQGYTPTTYQ